MFDFIQKLFGFKQNSDNDDSAVPNHSVIIKDDLSTTNYIQEGKINQNEKGECSDLCDFSCSCC